MGKAVLHVWTCLFRFSLHDAGKQVIDLFRILAQRANSSLVKPLKLLVDRSEGSWVIIPTWSLMEPSTLKRKFGRDKFPFYIIP
jgi:hypothetical protein